MPPRKQDPLPAKPLFVQLPSLLKDKGEYQSAEGPEKEKDKEPA